MVRPCLSHPVRPCCTEGLSPEEFQTLSAPNSLSSRSSFPGPSLVLAPPRLLQPGGCQRPPRSFSQPQAPLPLPRKPPRLPEH